MFANSTMEYSYKECIVWSAVIFLLSMSTQKAKVFVTCCSRVFVVVLEGPATQADG